jgi:hypothetical protein
MPGKKTVSLKKFLTDYRTGASEAELMSRHGLDKRGLQKIFRVLEERELVPAATLKGNSASPVHQEPLVPEAPLSTSAPAPETDAFLGQPDQGPDSHSTCSQCGAGVTETMLTCPECGHVLPGETRWSRVQPERTALRRVPPWLVGCFIALPIAIGLYFMFKHVLIPLSTASIHQRVQAVGKTVPTHGKPHPGTTEEKPASLPIYEQVRVLTAQGILQAANADYTAFTVTERWYDISRDAKIALVTQLGTALLASGMTGPFEVKDDSGIPGARVNQRAIELLDRYGFAETIERNDTDSGQPPPATQEADEPPARPDLDSTGQPDSQPTGIGQ